VLHDFKLKIPSQLKGRELILELMVRQSIPINIIENNAIKVCLFILIIIFDINRNTNKTTKANAMVIPMKWFSVLVKDLIIEAPPKMYAESRANDNVLRVKSPIFADIRPPKRRPTSFKLKSDLEFILSSQRTMADTYVIQQKKISRNKLPTIPKLAKTIGKEIIPDPIAVPANRDIAPNCFPFIIDTIDKKNTEQKS
jgi:hypothetical protein